jgi:host factor-I protein
MSELNIGLPSVRIIQSYIKEKKHIQIKLITGEIIKGRIAWQDPECISMVNENDQPILLWRQSIVYLQN